MRRTILGNSPKEVIATLLVIAAIVAPTILWLQVDRRFPLAYGGGSRDHLFAGSAFLLGALLTYLLRRRVFGSSGRGVVLVVLVLTFAVSFTSLAASLFQGANAILDTGKPKEVVVGVLAKTKSSLRLESGSGDNRKVWLADRPPVYEQVGRGGVITLSVRPGLFGCPWIAAWRVDMAGAVNEPVGVRQ